MVTDHEVSLNEISRDLAAEEKELDVVVSGGDDSMWMAATPAQGWDVRDQIGHLALGEELASLAASDPNEFGQELARLMSAPDHGELRQLQRGRAMAAREVLDWWREARALTLSALALHEATDRIPWVVGDMSALSFASARLMETWAHGQDVADAVGVVRQSSDRIYHVARLGVQTRRFSYRNRGLRPPDEDVRVELVSPSGAVWAWGDPEAAARVAGTALDFCLVVTQRRSVDDTSLEVVGDAAHQWMRIAQVFAGPPTGPRPRAKEQR